MYSNFIIQWKKLHKKIYKIEIHKLKIESVRKCKNKNEEQKEVLFNSIECEVICIKSHKKITINIQKILIKQFSIKINIKKKKITITPIQVQVYTKKSSHKKPSIQQYSISNKPQSKTPQSANETIENQTTKAQKSNKLHYAKTLPTPRKSLTTILFQTRRFVRAQRASE